MNKQYSEAKDNVKFLTTLERQFKVLTHPGLKGVEETLPSLMNGLRTIWIISRHYKTDDKMKHLIQLISDEIADKVEGQIKINELFKMSEDKPYEEQMQDAMELINKGS